MQAWCLGLRVSLADIDSGLVFFVIVVISPFLLSPVCLGGDHHGLLPLANAPGLINHLPLICLIAEPLYKMAAQCASLLDHRVTIVSTALVISSYVTLECFLIVSFFKK